jgi:hypothetical protein
LAGAYDLRFDGVSVTESSFVSLMAHPGDLGNGLRYVTFNNSLFARAASTRTSGYQAFGSVVLSGRPLSLLPNRYALTHADPLEQPFGMTLAKRWAYQLPEYEFRAPCRATFVSMPRRSAEA